MRAAFALTVASLLVAAGTAAAADVRLSPTKRIARDAGLELRFAVPQTPRRAVLKLRARDRGRLFVSRVTGRLRRLDRPPVRGRRDGRVVRFALSGRIRSGRVRLLVTRRAGRRPRGVTRAALVVRSPQGPQGAATVWAAGDIACDPDDDAFNGGEGAGSACRQRATSDLLPAEPADAVLALGDLQYEEATLAQFMASYDPSWGRVKSRTFPVPGNHEYGTAGAAGYFDYFNGTGSAEGRAGRREEGWYSFDVGAWHLVALNSNCTIVDCSADSAQLRWLRADLAANARRCTLAFFHHPRFSADTTVGSTARVGPFWDALYAVGADVVLAGHAHTYERFAPQAPDGTFDPERGLRQFVVGTGGKGLHALGPPLANTEAADATTLGALRLSLATDRYSWEFRPAVGGFTDSGTGVCH